ncbi:MAG: cupin domain-containing protein [Trueperaceae bacterium]|nr:MAG: cupin domain-containing protein [Trueperaceae bacterium]
MKAKPLPSEPEDRSPAGALIRYLLDNPHGNMIHSTVPPGQINRATIHATVSEFWYVLSGEGELWRSDGTESQLVRLTAGMSVDIPRGYAFQYRNTGASDLTFICVAMPPWPGDQEAAFTEGPWLPTI